jgi:hypothetical protein
VLDESGIVIDSTAPPDLYGPLTLRGLGVLDLLPFKSAWAVITAITKARILGTTETTRFQAPGHERVAVVVWKDGAAHLHSTPARDPYAHHVRILTRMAM